MAEEAGRALWERMEAHHKAGYLSLHMPGHKENAALAPYLARLGAELDITELPESELMLRDRKIEHSSLEWK